jgi:crossover junction endodeoxyribonuclease RuvC
VTLRVLGVDPGLTRCGIGVVDVEKNRRATMVAVGVVGTSPE